MGYWGLEVCFLCYWFDFIFTFLYALSMLIYGLASVQSFYIWSPWQAVLEKLLLLMRLFMCATCLMGGMKICWLSFFGTIGLLKVWSLCKYHGFIIVRPHHKLLICIFVWHWLQSQNLIHMCAFFLSPTNQNRQLFICSMFRVSKTKYAQCF